MTKTDEQKIEECCDALAFDIDQKEGNISDDDINTAIDEAAREAKVDRETFLKVFQDLYACNPFVYTDNARDDASEAKHNPRGETASLDPNECWIDTTFEGLLPLGEEDVW